MMIMGMVMALLADRAMGLAAASHLRFLAEMDRYLRQPRESRRQRTTRATA